MLKFLNGILEFIRVNTTVESLGWVEKIFKALSLFYNQAETFQILLKQNLLGMKAEFCSN